MNELSVQFYLKLVSFSPKKTFSLRKLFSITGFDVINDSGENMPKQLTFSLCPQFYKLCY